MIDYQAFKLDKSLKKEIPTSPIIYCILNKENGKRYIGQTTNGRRRYAEHINSSESETWNKYLQAAYQKYGLESFEFIILESVSKEELDTREGYYIDKFKTLNPKFGYNLAIVHLDGTKSHKPEIWAEMKRKATETRRNKSKFTWEIINKIRAEFNSGKTCSQLARDFNQDFASVTCICQNRNWPDSNFTPRKFPAPSKCVIPESLKSQILLEYQTGVSARKIKQKYNLNYNRLWIFLKEQLNVNELPVRQNSLWLDLETGIYYFSAKEAAESRNLDPKFVAGHSGKIKSSYKLKGKMPLVKV